MSVQTINKLNQDQLSFFKQLILNKLKEAEKTLVYQRAAASNTTGNGTEDTAPTFKSFDEGSKEADKETASQLSFRLEKFIRDLKNALIRIENKTYGVCAETGEIINPERLKSVPHATLSIKGKKIREKRKDIKSRGYVRTA